MLHSVECSQMKNKFTAVVPSAVASALLLIALAPIREYGYFILLRWAVCAAAIWFCIAAYGVNRKGLLGIGIPIAILFNPLVPIYLHRSTWAPIDAIVAVILFGSSWFVRQRKDSSTPPSAGT